MTRSVVQLGGQALKLDADGDTTIQVSSDDVLIVDTAGNEALKIDANGHVIKPLQPAFMATLSANVSNIAVSSSYSLVCNTEIFDNNGDYDTSNGTFTAPVTGKYALYFNTRTESIPTDGSWWQWTIDASNRDVHILTSVAQFDQTTDYYGQNIAMIMDMDASDTAKMSLYINGGSQQVDINANATFFGGHLIG